MWQTETRRTDRFERRAAVPGGALAWIKWVWAASTVRTAADPTFRVVTPPSTTGEG
jgi:hypothetical protein